MVMTDTATALHNFLAGTVFDLTVDSNWVRQSCIDEAKVNVDCCSSIVDLNRFALYLRHTERNKGLFLYTVLLTVADYSLFDSFAHLRDVFPRN